MTGGGVQAWARHGSPRQWLAAGWVCGCLAGGLTVGAVEPDAAATSAELRTQVRVLSEALATARAENDFLRARLDRQEVESGGGAVGDWVPGGRGARDIEYRIVDVNKGLGLAVLNAGRRQGVRPGMTFAVMQGDRSVATLRVVDARGAVAGAVIETTAAWRYPRAQDRAIRVAGTRE
jgi:hypothetical protein